MPSPALQKGKQGATHQGGRNALALFILGERKEQGLHSSDSSYQLPSDNENINKTTS